MNTFHRTQLSVLRLARDFNGIDVDVAIALGCSPEQLDELFIGNLMYTPNEGQRAMLTDQGVDECHALVNAGSLPEGTFDDVDVSAVEESDDDAACAKTHRAQFADGLIAYFQSEECACAFQRMWRVANENKAIAAAQSSAVRCVVGLEGGLITGFTSDHPLQVVVYDYDLEGAEPARVHVVPDLLGGDVEVFDHGIQLADIDPSKITGIFDHFERLQLARISETNAASNATAPISVNTEGA